MSPECIPYAMFACGLHISKNDLSIIIFWVIWTEKIQCFLIRYTGYLMLLNTYIWGILSGLCRSYLYMQKIFINTNYRRSYKFERERRKWWKGWRRKGGMGGNDINTVFIHKILTKIKIKKCMGQIQIKWSWSLSTDRLKRRIGHSKVECLGNAEWLLPIVWSPNCYTLTTN